MPESSAEVVRARCPSRGSERKAYVRRTHVIKHSNNNSVVASTDTAMILECCGCERIFFRRDFWFSEWETIAENPYTGGLQREANIETTYWPEPVNRKSPEWIDDIAKADEILGKLLQEMYTALNHDLRVLAAIGARTAFDRSAKLLNVDANVTFGEKLNKLVAISKIGNDERDTLEVLVDAGNAAAHRGWPPNPEVLDTIISIVEAFLHRAFVLDNGIQKLRAAVPQREKRSTAGKNPAANG